jgi:hypothetical protein
MKFLQKKDGSCDIVFTDEEVDILVKYKKLQLPKSSTKDFINNVAKIIFELNDNLDDKTKNLQSNDSFVSTNKPKD